MWNLPLPWTMLAGCGSVCIRNTAHKSTLQLGSLPSEGSRQRTNKSLHRIPISGRGVSSGAKQSTCTIDWSPWAFIASNDTVALRTTRVRSNGPSIMRRLGLVRTGRFRSGGDKTYRWGWTRGLGNFPLILACHLTSLRRDSDSRFPSFMLLASEDISLKERSRGSSAKS